MSNLKVSIITVCYNSAATIEDTIKSVRAQRYKNIEYIVVDGNSTDLTNDIVEKYRSTVSVHISERDAGLYDAMNKGIKVSTGDVVGILNSDDVLFDDDSIHNIVKAFSDDTTLNAVYADVGFYDQTLATKKRHYSSSGFAFSKLKFGIMPAHPSLYIKRDLFANLGFYSLGYKIAADFDMIVRLFSLPDFHSKYLRQEIVKMRMGGISTSGFSANVLLNREILISLKNNGIYSSYLHLLIKYPKKILGFIFK